MISEILILFLHWNSISNLKHSFRWIDISKQCTAAQVEQDFMHQPGLRVQVMRKSGGMWGQTTKTDHRTLQQLSEEAKPAEKSIFFYPEKPAE
ncbi:hypothetical protein GO495_16760 [Chitinophaga oryziterrae]|uniref:Uncharacterized protein n=1 Tax=Chitinophaga oryziterrae TaxID=1031224 RepID=A0A6N8JBA5_9BACT|nr:hypothetical protein [Chitinophaga oryziterrae]MVT42244.1 hypothetical protein [Chitinophaga oryziterrae]